MPTTEESDLGEEQMLEKVLDIEIAEEYLSALLTDDEVQMVLKLHTKIMNPGKGEREVDVYCPTAILLNTLNLVSYKYLSQKSTPDDTAIVFLLNLECPLRGDVFDTQIKPDIVAKRSTLNFIESYLKQLKQSVKDGVPPKVCSERPSHGELSSPVEVKESTSARSQELHYCRVTKAARVDMRRVFGLSVTSQGYHLTRIDACSAIVSSTYQWNNQNFNNLLRYVLAVYRSESERDKSLFTYVQGTEQVWTIDLKEKLTVRPFYSTYPPGRTTWVAAGFNHRAEHRLVKIANINVNVRSSEGALYAKAHSKGWIPGLARVVQSDVLNTPLVTGGEVSISRQKCAVVLGSIGEPLNNCGSVLEFLKVMYDALQTLEEMALNDVMHRYVSWSNVLCHPQHHYDVDNQLRPEKDVPYIDKILGITNPRCKVLITDLDHGEMIDDSTGATKPGRIVRTGTPMFIAMEIATLSKIKITEYSVAHLVNEFIGAEPRCLGEFLEFFSNVGTLIYDSIAKRNAPVAKWNRDQDSGTAKPLANSDVVPANDRTSAAPYHAEHRPRHDAESIFWLIVWTLSRMFPNSTDTTAAETTDAYDHFCTTMLHHRVATRYEKVGRGAYLKMEEESWEEILHPDLGHLASMVSKMGQYFGMDWATYEPKPNCSVATRRVHAFQAMKALLLVEILRMHQSSQPIEFFLKSPRQARMLGASANFRQNLTSPETRAGKSESASSDRITRADAKRKAVEGTDEDARPHKKPKQEDEKELDVQPIASGSKSGPLAADLRVEFGDMNADELGEPQRRQQEAIEDESQHRDNTLQQLYTAEEKELFLRCEAWSKEFQTKKFPSGNWFAP